MRRFTTPQRIAIEVIARHLSASWERTPEQGNNPPGVTLRIGRKRIAVDIATLSPYGTVQSNAPKPRLRFDKVATKIIHTLYDRLINSPNDHLNHRLQTNLAAPAPASNTVLLASTAPIRLPSKTAASIEAKIKDLLRLSTAPPPDTATLYGNCIHLHVATNQSPHAPKLIAFVHNADSDPLLLLNIAHELLVLPSALPNALPNALPSTLPSALPGELHNGLPGELNQPRPKPATDRWLILSSAREISSLNAYRTAYSQLRLPTHYKKAFIVFTNGTVLNSATVATLAN